MASAIATPSGSRFKDRGIDAQPRHRAFVPSADSIFRFSCRARRFAGYGSRIHNEEERSMLLHIAETWQRLADQEKINSGRSSLARTRRIGRLQKSPPIVRETTRNEQMDGYIVAGPPSTFPFQPNDGRTVRFPAIFALRADFVRHVRVAAHVWRLRRTHTTAVWRASSFTPSPHLLHRPHTLNSSLCRPILPDLALGRACLVRAHATP
jgi:hypothetical protein